MGLLADTFIQCAKEAVDRADGEAATLAITFLRQTFEFELGDDSRAVFRRSRELGLLVLLAWILFRKDNELSDSKLIEQLPKSNQRFRKAAICGSSPGGPKKTSQRYAGGGGRALSISVGAGLALRLCRPM